MAGMIELIYEDNHLLAVNKPAGVLSQGDETGDPSILDAAKEYIKKEYKKEGNVYCGLIHRLDRPASGVLLLAKSSKALERMNEKMRNRKIKKTYWALTENFTYKESRKLVHWLLKNEEQKKVHVFGKEKKGAKRSEMKYQLLGRIGKNYLLEIDLLTGRYHQARAQLAAEKMPIKGDVKYGYGKSANNGQVYLHCVSIEFEHPVKKENLKIAAGLPKDPVWQEFKGFQS